MHFFQIRSIPSFFKTFCSFFERSAKDLKGIHPLQAFCTSMAGMFGIGNIVGVLIALQLGGPGALFWVWIAALFGSIIKYAETFLALKHRVPNNKGGYDGGPMYFLKEAFRKPWIPASVAGLFCIYGTDVYQFNVLTNCLSKTLDIPNWIIMVGLLSSVLLGGLSGIKRVAKVCSLILPFFLLTYISMSLWIIVQEARLLPSIFTLVFKSAFQGHAALGGFAGSSVLLAIQHGTARVAYSADLGVGYTAIVQSESKTIYPEKQASLAVLGVFIDNFICTISILLVLITGFWTATPPIPTSELVQSSLGEYFPYMSIFVPVFLLIAGYTTLISYFCAGMKCARFLSPKQGKKIYILYSALAFFIFSFFDQSAALLVMSISGALLLIINLIGIFYLRDQISFSKHSKKTVLKTGTHTVTPL